MYLLYSVFKMSIHGYFLGDGGDAAPETGGEPGESGEAAGESGESGEAAGESGESGEAGAAAVSGKCQSLHYGG